MIFMKLSMHVCCAPCSVYCIKTLRSEGIEPVVFWYNPNIHPYTEYRERRDCLIEYANLVGIEAIIEEVTKLKKRKTFKEFKTGNDLVANVFPIEKYKKIAIIVVSKKIVFLD